MMSLSKDFRELKDTISSALVGSTRAAGQISNEDLAFHRSSNPPIAKLLDRQNARLLKLADGLTKAATRGTEVPPPQLRDAESVDENWNSIVDVFDNVLEKADACLDEFTGSIKRLSPGLEDQIQKAAPVPKKPENDNFRHSQEMIKPQLLFEDVPNNNEETPFRPLLRNKPHALVPLQESLGLIDSSDESKQYDAHFYLSMRDVPPQMKHLIDAKPRYKHPYDLEIRTARYPPSTFVKADPITYLSFDDTKATFVDTPEAIATMLADLQQANEIAIDLEHHDEHSYTGLVSLMQISTRTKDWVVDTLKPWRRDLQVLNEVFTNPNILKVLHGAFMDIVWLQRDLGLYIVNLFDTFHASRALGYPQKSLAYLLKTFANVDAAKKYQMADWRIRPLPEAMFNYARSDTHYLLFIFDNMRNALIEKIGHAELAENLIETVMGNSKEVALQRYERYFYDPERGSGSAGWYNMLCRTPALFTREQFAVFRAVHQWRDGIARLEDESLQVVMQKRVLYNIAREIPIDVPSLLGCSHPMSKIFQKRKEELLGVIKRAKGLGATGPDMKEVMQEIEALPKQSAMGISGANAMFGNGVRTETKLNHSVQQIETISAPRLDSSRFWGPHMSGARSLGPMKERQHHFLALPLPQMTAKVFEENDQTSRPRKDEAESSSIAIIESQSVENKFSKKSDVFILKEDGGSRKRKVALATNPEEKTEPEIREANAAAFMEETDELLDETSELERKRVKAERKAEKKRSKKAKADEANQSVVHANEAPEAFDYAKAPSILHAEQTPARQAALPQQGFNPYAKSMDAPKAMRNGKKEIAGKSHTFTS